MHGGEYQTFHTPALLAHLPRAGHPRKTPIRPAQAPILGTWPASSLMYGFGPSLLTAVIFDWLIVCVWVGVGKGFLVCCADKREWEEQVVPHQRRLTTSNMGEPGIIYNPTLPPQRHYHSVQHPIRTTLQKISSFWQQDTEWLNPGESTDQSTDSKNKHAINRGKSLHHQ